MVQIVENWAELIGTLRSIAPSSKGPDHRTLTIEVETINDVEGFPNLIGEQVGESVDVHARADLVERSGVEEGNRIRCRIGKATPFEIFTHPEGFKQLANQDRATAADDGDPPRCDPTIESSD